MSTLESPLSTPLSALLRQRTASAHERAENSAFVIDLVAGSLPLSAYTALLVQNYAIYRALEDLAEQWREHPTAGAFVRPEVFRMAQVERDLAALLGSDWAAAAQSRVLPATVRYARRITAVGGRSAGAYVAHHYVRYLGDLSGGQILRAAAVRAYGAAVADATHFFTFEGIGKIKPYRDAYRASLDLLPFGPAERDAMLAEAVVAFRLNHDVFDELGRRGLGYGVEEQRTRG